MKKQYIFLGIVCLLAFVGSATLIIISLSRNLPLEETQMFREALGLHRPEVVGFQPYWLAGDTRLTYHDKVTTLAYFGLAVDANGGIRQYDNPGEFEPGYAKLQDTSYRAYLQDAKKAGVKLSLLVVNMDEDDILSIVSKPEESAKNLVASVSGVMREVGFSDLNLDIESFVETGEATRSAYTNFVQAVKNELQKEKLGTLTVELTPKSPIVSHLIDVSAIGAIADRVILMAYDYHTILSGVCGSVAPLGGVPDDEEYDVTTALNETLRLVPKDKVILGIPTYGYQWETLRDTPGSPVIPGSWGLATSKRMEEMIASDATYSATMDPVAQTPYLIVPGETNGHWDQMYYENSASLSKKLTLALQDKIAGVAFWAMGYESPDFFKPLPSYKNQLWWEQEQKPGVVLSALPFVLAPPTKALQGNITSATGIVKKQGRSGGEFTPIEKGADILEGEAVFFENGDGMVTIGQTTFAMDEGSEMLFERLVAPNFFSRHKGGTISYITKDEWSTRVLRSLVTLIKGTMDVSIDNGTAVVRVRDGEALIGNISEENETSTYTVSKGHRAIIDGNAKTVVVR